VFTGYSGRRKYFYRSLRERLRQRVSVNIYSFDKKDRSLRCSPDTPVSGELGESGKDSESFLCGDWVPPGVSGVHRILRVSSTELYQLLFLFVFSCNSWLCEECVWSMCLISKILLSCFLKESWSMPCCNYRLVISPYTIVFLQLVIIQVVILVDHLCFNSCFQVTSFYVKDFI
jgi:hypothetical protein